MLFASITLFCCKPAGAEAYYLPFTLKMMRRCAEARARQAVRKFVYLHIRLLLREVTTKNYFLTHAVGNQTGKIFSKTAHLSTR